MYWIIGICAVVVFNVFVFMFMYGAGKANKKYDEQTEKFFENQKLPNCTTSKTKNKK